MSCYLLKLAEFIDFRPIKQNHVGLFSWWQPSESQIPELSHLQKRCSRQHFSKKKWSKTRPKSIENTSFASLYSQKKLLLLNVEKLMLDSTVSSCPPDPSKWISYNQPYTSSIETGLVRCCKYISCYLLKRADFINFRLVKQIHSECVSGWHQSESYIPELSLLQKSCAWQYFSIKSGRWQTRKQLKT